MKTILRTGRLNGIIDKNKRRISTTFFKFYFFSFNMNVVSKLLRQERILLDTNSKRLLYLQEEFITIVQIMNNPYETLEKPKKEFYNILQSAVANNDMNKVYNYDTEKLVEIGIKISEIISKNTKKLVAIKSDKILENKRILSEIKRNKKKILLLKMLEKKLPKKAKTDAETLRYRDEILKREQEIGEDLKDYIWVNQQRIEEADTLISQYDKMRREVSWQRKIIKEINEQKRKNTVFIARNPSGKPLDMSTAVKKMLDSMSAEFSIIESLEKHYKTGVEDSKLRDIIMQEERLIDIINDFLLFLRIFEIPKCTFPSGNYATFPAGINNLKQFSMSRYVDLSPIAKEHDFKLAGRVFRVSESVIKLNEFYTNDFKEDCCVVFPLENIMTGHFFILRGNKEIIIFFTLVDKEEEIRILSRDMQLFDKIIKESDMLFSNWLNETIPLSEKFREDLRPTARSIIFNNFTKRWVKDEAELFRENNNTQLDFVDFITEMDWISKIDKQLEEKFQERPDEERIKPKDFLEEFMKLNLEGFKRVVAKAKIFYKECLDDAVFFIRKSSPLVSNEEGIFVLHRSRVLDFEKYCQKINYRPRNVYYYHCDDIEEGVRNCYKECRKNFFLKKIPRTRFLRIFSLPSFRKMEFFNIK